ncbi:hypothetical protein ACOMHN_016761 [Nucella lapillus]
MALQARVQKVTTLLDLTALGWPELLPPTSSRIFCCSKSLRASGERNSRGGRGGGVIGRYLPVVAVVKRGAASEAD